MTFTSGGVDIMSIDGNNNKMVIKDYGLSILGPIENTLNMNGNTFINVGAPTEPGSLVNKTYVDSFFDQLALQM